MERARDPYKFRSKARFVAFADLIFSSMSLCLCLLSLTILLRLSAMGDKEREVMIAQYHGKTSAATPIMEMDVGQIEMQHEIEVQPEGEAKYEGEAQPESEAKLEGEAQIEGEAQPEGEAKLEGEAQPAGDPQHKSKAQHERKDDVMIMAEAEGGIAPLRLGKNEVPIPKIPKIGFLDPAFVKLLWMVWTLATTMTAVHIAASIRLLNATQLGKEPIGALRLCRFWRLVCIFFTGLLVFNFLSAFRQEPENFFQVAFLASSILARIVALYIVQLYAHELDMTILNTLPIRRIHHATSSHIPPTYGGPGGDLFAKFQVPFPPERQEGMPPKYEDVVKEPYKGNQEA